jgi:hypothetical protein
MVTGLAPICLSSRKMAARTVKVGTASAEPTFMGDRLHIASGPMTFKAEVLFVAGEAAHPIRLRPKAMAPIFEEKGMASRRCRHVAVKAKGLVGMAVAAVCFEFFNGDGAMDPLPVNSVVVGLLVLPPDAVATLAHGGPPLCRLPPPGMTVHAVFHRGNDDRFICPGLSHVPVTFLARDPGLFVVFVLEFAVFEGGPIHTPRSEIHSGVTKGALFRRFRAESDFMAKGADPFGRSFRVVFRKKLVAEGTGVSPAEVLLVTETQAGRRFGLAAAQAEAAEKGHHRETHFARSDKGCSIQFFHSRPDRILY